MKKCLLVDLTSFTLHLHFSISFPFLFIQFVKSTNVYKGKTNSLAVKYLFTYMYSIFKLIKPLDCIDFCFKYVTATNLYYSILHFFKSQISCIIS